MITIQGWTNNILIMRSRGRTEKSKMDKSAIGQKPKRIKLKVDKTPQNRKYFNTPTISAIKVHGPMIT